MMPVGHRSQEHDGTEFPIAFLSHTFIDTQWKWMKCLIWLYLMETSQYTTAYTRDIWAYCMMKPRQWKFQKINSKHAKRPTYSFAVYTHPFYHWPTH